MDAGGADTSSDVVALVSEENAVRRRGGASRGQCKDSANDDGGHLVDSDSFENDFLERLGGLDLRYGDVSAGGGNTHPVLANLAVAQYSPRATIYYDAMDEKTREVVDAIGRSDVVFRP